MQPISLIVSHTPGGTREEHRLSFCDEDRLRLDRYYEYAGEVAQLKALPSIYCSVRVEMSEGAPTENNIELPDWDHVTVLLHRLRPLVLTKEPTYFRRVAGIIRRQLEHGLLSQSIDSLQKQFSGKQVQSMMTIETQGKIINSEAMLTTWLNGFEYHRDEKKRSEIESIKRALPEDLLNALFVDLLLEKTRAILGLRRIVALLIGKQRIYQTAAP